MVLTLIRRPTTKGATLSAWYLNGHPIGYGVEDPVRGPSERKIFGQTAIPAGTYKVIINRSERFSKLAGREVLLPLLLNVPGYEGVRIHPGNAPKDTEGCLLPGTAIGPDGASVINSRAAFANLFSAMQVAFANHEPITCIVR